MLLTVPTEYISLLPPDVDSTRLTSALENGVPENIVDRLERKLKALTDSPYAVCVSSGTAAIHTALQLLNIKKGDTVLAPTSSFIALASPIKMAQAEAHFVDVSFNEWNLKAEELKTAFRQQKPSAIISVNNYGLPDDLSWKKTISGLEDIPVIEDNAEGLGAKANNTMAGTLGDIGVISFNTNKIVTGFGGGVLLLKSEEQYLRAKRLIDHGRNPLMGNQFDELGYNYRISPLNALCVFLELDDLNLKLSRKTEINTIYKEELEPLGFQFQQEDKGKNIIPNYWLSGCFHPEIGNITIEVLKQIMNDNKIEIRSLWKPMTQNSLFKNCGTTGEQNAQFLYENGICLPSSTSLSNSQQEKVISCLKKALKM